MLPHLRKTLMLVLAMLQFFAPLVHAHTGDKNFNQGLHIPGLESYLAHQDAPVLHNVNVEWDAEGLLVMVDTGIKNTQDVSVASIDSDFALLPSNQLQVSALPETDNNFSPQHQSFSFRRLSPVFSPRAPPAQ
jgi:hypothetical protein